MNADILMRYVTTVENQGMIEMAELKTMENLRIHGSRNHMFNMGAGDQYYLIRKEAIKWYKYLDKRANEEKCSDKIKKILKGQREILLLFFDIKITDMEGLD